VGSADAKKPLADRVAVVTGGSRGIGRATAEKLVDAGASVAIMARGSHDLDAVAHDLDQTLAVPVDLRDPAQVDAGFVRIEQQLGRVDLLVNNAAIAIAARVADTTNEDIDAQVGTNFLGTVYATRAALPMLRRARGAVVIVSSESAHDPFPYLSIYGATKAALESFAHGLRNEVHDDGIRVATFIAGLTDTGGFSARWSSEVRDAAVAAWEAGGFLRRVAGGVPQAPGDVADAIVFLATRPQTTTIDVMSCRAAR
jgi:NADP-dependent 3-hydroxy acid dehydrogenase YdfG